MLANNQVNRKTETYLAAKLEFYFENKRFPAPCFPFLIVTPEVKNLKDKNLSNYQKLSDRYPTNSWAHKGRKGGGGRRKIV